MPPQDVRLVDHVASSPESLDFLQSYNVSVAYGIGNAIEIIALIQSQTITDIIGYNFYQVISSEGMFDLRRRTDCDNLTS